MVRPEQGKVSKIPHSLFQAKLNHYPWLLMEVALRNFHFICLLAEFHLISPLRWLRWALYLYSGKTHSLLKESYVISEAKFSTLPLKALQEMLSASKWQLLAHFHLLQTSWSDDSRKSWRKASCNLCSLLASQTSQSWQCLKFRAFVPLLRSTRQKLLQIWCSVANSFPS